MKSKEIISQNNPVFKTFLRLLKGRGVKKHGMTLLSGQKQVQEVLRDFPRRCAGIVLTEGQEIPGGRVPEGITKYHLSLDLFRQIDVFGTDQPILMVRVKEFQSWAEKPWPIGCTLFIPFQDPVNVGAVVRSAVAFGVSRVVMLKEAAHPFHHKSVRVAGSALFRAHILKGPSIRELGGPHVPIITLSPEGKDIAGHSFPSTFGLLPGIEGPGLPDNSKNRTALAIPMEPGVESINSALATGIALYVWRSGLRKSLRQL